jgi:DNA helicase HerA-like ATPase
MRLYRKEGNTVQILSFPGEDVEKGDYLLIEEKGVKKALVVQVIDVQYAGIPGILEDLLRETPADERITGEDFDPLGVSSHITYIQDSCLLICKIRSGVENGRLSQWSSWLPSRSNSSIKKLSATSLLSMINLNNDLPIVVGEMKDAAVLTIDARCLDGKLNIVTGKKETGKSHLSKLLALGLVDCGAGVVVFDLNGEYTGLEYDSEGKKNAYKGKVHVLTPGQNFKVSLSQLNLRVMLNILIHALHLPGTSAREFRHIWRFLDEKGALNLHELGEAIRNWQCNIHVRDALFSRYHAMLNSGFFSDNLAQTVSLDDFLYAIRVGGMLVVNLKDTSAIDRQIVVEFVLGKLLEALTNWKLRAIFLFAEEAHLYLRETYWDDIVTRMRHFGVFTTFITNQPDTIRESIYRQADNIFLFNFTNEHDLETVSRAARVDGETVRSIARDLPQRHCLALGKAVRDFPIVVKVRALNVKTMGQTRLFFSQKPPKIATLSLAKASS